MTTTAPDTVVQAAKAALDQARAEAREAAGTAADCSTAREAQLDLLRSGVADVTAEELTAADALCTRADLLARAAFDRIGPAGWAIRVLDPDIDLTTISGRAMAGVLMVFASFERETIGQRVKSGMAQKRCEGGVFGSRSADLDVVSRIVLAHHGGAGWSEIAKDLNAAEVPTRAGQTVGGYAARCS